MLAGLKKSKVVCRVITIVAVIASALLQMPMIQAFIRPANLLSGGFTGVTILVGRITSLHGYSFSTSLSMLTLNIPVAFLCSKSIGVRFMFYSMMQIFLTSFFLKVPRFQSMFDDMTLNVVSGGFLYGIGVAIALRGSMSTGGMGFIVLCVSGKTERSIWGYVFAGNVLILCIFGLIFGWTYIGYSILSQYISTWIISVFHYRYERVTPQITTSKAETVIKAHVAHYRHGISCMDAVGGHSHKKMNLFRIAVSSHEMPDIMALMREEGPHAIVSMIRTENFYGGPHQASME